MDRIFVRGYQYVDSRDEMLNLSSGKTWGLFASSHMAPDIALAELAPEEPSLAEMTKLSKLQLNLQKKMGIPLFWLSLNTIPAG